MNIKLYISLVLCLIHTIFAIENPNLEKAVQKFSRRTDIFMCIQLIKFLPFEEMNNKIRIIDGEAKEMSEGEQEQVEMVHL